MPRSASKARGGARRGAKSARKRAGAAARPRESGGERSADAPRARPFWSGTVTFGLVSIPVDLYPANRPRQAGMRMLAPDGTPLRREYRNAETGRRIDTGEVVRGYEVESGEFVVLTDEELEGVEPERTRDIALDAFVELAELDPMFFDRAYFLAPQENAGKAYRLLAEVMEEHGLAGIARFVMRSKEYLVAIMAEGGILRAETMRFAEEVRAPEDVGLPEAPKKPKAAAIKTMIDAIHARASDALPEAALRDEYLAELTKIAEAKRRRGKDVIEVAEEAEGEGEEPGVIDLMEALRRSMQGARESRGRSEPRKGPKRAAAVGLDDLSKGELYERAKALDIPGRSGMTRDQLAAAIRKSA